MSDWNEQMKIDQFTHFATADAEGDPINRQHATEPWLYVVSRSGLAKANVKF
jgi:hypothetical protein